MNNNKYYITEILYYLFKFKKESDKSMQKEKYSQNTVLENMPNEIAFLKYTEKLFDIPNEKIVYYNNSKAETKEKFNQLCRQYNVNPQFIANVEKQLAGFDYEYNGFSIDLKVHGKTRDRVFVELFYNESTRLYYSKHIPFTHIYANVMLNDNTIRCYPIDLLVDIVNHKNISGLHLPYDFYNSNLFKSDCKTDSTKIHGSVGFAISADILTKAMRYYLPFVYQHNASMGELISNYTPIQFNEGDFIAV